MSVEERLVLASVVTFAAFVVLGLRVAKRVPSPLDVRGVYFRARWTRLARVLTRSGRASGIAIAFVVAFAIFLVAHEPAWIPLALLVSQLLSQGVVELFKALYGRTRPDYWLVGRDAGHSYPSGHAATAVVFVLGWALIVNYSGLAWPLRDVALVLLALWAGGIMWSRLALGAHYVTDVAGGALFGCAWQCAAAAVLMHVWQRAVPNH